MKVSKRTLAILKNFAGINQSLVIKPGNVITTISNTRDVLAQATVDETFESEFAIYDLNEFLGALSLFTEPEINFDEDNLAIVEGRRHQKFWYADASIITQPPSKELKLPSVDVDVALTKEDIAVLQKAASINNAPHVRFTGSKLEGERVLIVDATTPTSNSFSLNLSDSSNADYEMGLSIDKFKFLPLDYRVQISSKGMALFTNDEQKISYFLALAPGARYNA